LYLGTAEPNLQIYEGKSKSKGTFQKKKAQRTGSSVSKVFICVRKSFMVGSLTSFAPRRKVKLRV